ncbi:MAG TPA: P1 family peptidase [Anaerolineae bacterium]|nr:P1 family peptidase [Anaerolineae bacterium]
MDRRFRARELGLDLGLLPTGRLNSITDVAGVRVGHTTLIEGPSVRTGVTAVLAHGGNPFYEKVVAAVHTLNGYGKAMGFEQVRELGTLETPLLLCSTLNVGRVADGVITWLLARNPEIGRGDGSVNPLVAECFDGYLSDTRQMSVKAEHVWAAIDGAREGPFAEGNVGAGTGVIGFGYKGGIGSSSRRIEESYGGYTVGVLVVLNCGHQEQLLMGGRRLGQLLSRSPAGRTSEGGSIIMVLATDAPLSARQLGRLARRAPLGLARTGAIASQRSGDFVVAFSTAQRLPHHEQGITREITVLIEGAPTVNQLFQAAVDATEEAILNAICMAETMLGRDGHLRQALPLERVVQILGSAATNA